MRTSRQVGLLFAAAALYAAADAPWKTKQAADWTADDARLVLTDSPWAGNATAEWVKPSSRPRDGGSVGIGLPGIGMGRPRRGGGQQAPSAETGDVPVLHVRWESAQPIRDAEFKAREVSAPDIEEGSYAIAVYGTPARMARGDEKTLAAEFKRQAAIKREGQKGLKPSSVEVLQREDGPVIVYLFSRKTEITRQDRRLEFDAQIGQLQIMKAFYTDDMTWQGKLEL